jgi:arginyl-tRNA synthetase
METAKILKNCIDVYIGENKIIDSIAIAKPGFINIVISNSLCCETIKTIHKEGKMYGRTVLENPSKICLEFVSANPTGPMNIVSARAAALGDTLANILDAAGNSVDREFYVNNYGNQVDLLGNSVIARIRELKGEEVNFPEDGYHGEYIKDIANSIINSAYEEFSNKSSEEEKINFCAEYAVNYNVSGQKKDLQDFGVEFTRWFYEKTLHESGAVSDTFFELEKTGSIFEEDNKKFFTSIKYGDDKDRVVIREDGRPTYLLADIAYHRDKIKRKYDNIYDIWGPDHHGYIARLSGAMQALNYPKESFKVLIAQQVNLVMEGETVKMSKRLGKFSTMRELIEDVGVDAARYFFVMRSMESHLDFDLALAKRQSSENPVFYLQYAHARICSVFREADKRGMLFSVESLIENIDEEVLNNLEAQSLIKLLIKYPEEIQDAASTLEPHRLPSYLMKLAQAYHKFYTEHRIITEDKRITSTNLALCGAVRITIKNGLELLGVSSPESM